MAFLAKLGDRSGAGSDRWYEGTSRRPSLLAFVAVVLLFVGSGCATGPVTDASGATIEAVPDAPWGTATLDVQYYDLRHTTRSELQKEMMTAVLERGMRGMGYTKWEIGSNYHYAISDEKCSLTQLDISLELTVTLPRLRNPEGLDPSVRADWRRFMRALRNHESGHKQIAVDCASRLSSELGAIREASDCERLEATIESTMNDVIPSCHTRNAGFDERTRHGASEGATF